MAKQHQTPATDDPIERTIRAATVTDQESPDIGAALADPGTGYRLGRLLGQGGEGQVFEAVQAAFGRQVAIKVMRGEAPGPRQTRRFRAEAAISALLEHPAIIPVHDLRLDDHGRPQLVMKRVSGKTWRALLDSAPGPLKRPLSGEEHVDVLLKVCDALAFAHSRGILHRDLKPENVMVGEHGEVLVMDWGCAVHVGPKPPHPDIPTLADMHGVSGTPAYLSPEQARADHALCGPWSDVYLLGALLYRMLTGSPPHRGSDVAGTIRIAAKGEPARDPLATGVKAPPELTRIAIDAMHPDPAKRIRSADEFAAAIRRYLEHREVHRLLAEALRQHGVAKTGGSEGDDAYRRAISAVEQAVALWPEHIDARRLFIEIELDSARHALGAGAFRIARRQATAAASEAERLGDGPSIEAAQRLAGFAELRDRAAKGREAKLVAMRKLATGGGIVAVLAMLVGLLAVMRESSNTASALSAARENLERFKTEQEARKDGEKLATPALLAQARELAARHKLKEALAATLAAQGFAPDNPAPLTMAGQLLAAQGRRSEAASALERSLALKPDKLAEELRQICLAPGNDADMRIADVLVRMGAGNLAGALNLAAEQRAAVARGQLALVWPQLPKNAIGSRPDGTIRLDLPRRFLAIDSLEPLRGMPISELDLTDQTQLRDLTPLSAMPLTQVAIKGLRGADLAPVLGLRLRRLNAIDTAVDDPVQLRGMPLESLSLDIPGVASLGPLSGMPLRELKLSRCDALSDITALQLLPLEQLELSTIGTASLIDIGPLRGRLLRKLSFNGQRGLSNVSSLKGAPLVQVDLDSTAVVDLKPVVGPALRHLSIVDAAVDDLLPLQGSAIETLLLSPQRIKSGLAELRRIPSLRAVNDMPPEDFLRWYELQKRILADNPDYAWNGKAVYEGGKVVELRLPTAMRSLASLRGLPLRVLECPGGRFSDLAPLKGMPLIHLDLSNGQFKDVSVLAANVTLRRLHLAGIQLSDLRPIADLPLQELTFSPKAATQGVDVLRRSTTLEKAGNNPRRMLTMREFWIGVDRGDIR